MIREGRVFIIILFLAVNINAEVLIQSNWSGYVGNNPDQFSYQMHLTYGTNLSISLNEPISNPSFEIQKAPAAGDFTTGILPGTSAFLNPFPSGWQYWDPDGKNMGTCGSAPPSPDYYQAYWSSADANDPGSQSYVKVVNTSYFTGSSSVYFYAYTPKNCYHHYEGSAIQMQPFDFKPDYITYWARSDNIAGGTREWCRFYLFTTSYVSNSNPNLNTVAFYEGWKYCDNTYQAGIARDIGGSATGNLAANTGYEGQYGMGPKASAVGADGNTWYRYTAQFYTNQSLGPPPYNLRWELQAGGWEEGDAVDGNLYIDNVYFSDAQGNKLTDMYFTNNNYLISRTFNITNSTIIYTAIEWSANIPANTAIKFQLSSSSNNITWSPFVGPGNNISAFYTNSGQAITPEHNNMKYMRYKVDFLTSDPFQAPTLDSFMINYAIETNPPSKVSVILPLYDTITNSSTMIFNWTSATDDLSGVADYQLHITNYNMNWGTNFVTITTNCIINNIREGTNYWRVRARDNANNYSGYSNTNRLILDLTGPSITLISPFDNKWEVELDVQFQWSLYDLYGITNQRIEIDTNNKIGDGYEVVIYTNSPFTNIFRRNSTNHWHIWAQDKNGNISISPDRTVFIYTNKPIAALYSPLDIELISGNVLFNWSDVQKLGVVSNVIQISLQSNFSLVNIEVKSNGGFTNWNASSPLGDKIWYWRVLTYQTNTSAWYTSVVKWVWVDATGPAITSLNFPSFIDGRNDVVLKAYASETGYGDHIVTNAGYSFSSWDDATNNPLVLQSGSVSRWCTNFFFGTNFMSFPQGTYYVYVRAKDSVGHWSDRGVGINSNTFVVDKVDHFIVSHTTNVARSSETPVVIKVYDWQNNLLTDYAGEVNIDTTAGSPAASVSWRTFSGNGKLTNTAGDTAKYKFSPQDNGVVTLFIKDTKSEVISISVRVYNTAGWHTDDGTQGTINYFNAPIVDCEDILYGFPDYTKDVNFKVTLSDLGGVDYFILNESQTAQPATNSPLWEPVPGSGITNYTITSNPGADGLKKIYVWCKKSNISWVLPGAVTKYIYLDTEGPTNISVGPSVVPTLVNKELEISRPTEPIDAGIGTFYWRIKRVNDGVVIGGTNLLNVSTILDSTLISNKLYSFQIQFMDKFHHTNGWSPIGENYTLPAKPDIIPEVAEDGFYTLTEYNFTNKLAIGDGGADKYYYKWTTDSVYTVTPSDTSWTPGAPNITKMTCGLLQGYWYLYIKSYNPYTNSTDDFQTRLGPFKYYEKVPGPFVLTATKTNVLPLAYGDDSTVITTPPITNIQPGGGYIPAGKIFIVEAGGHRINVTDGVAIIAIIPDYKYQITSQTNGFLQFTLKSSEIVKMNLTVTSFENPGSTASIMLNFYPVTSPELGDIVLLNTIVKPEQGERLKIIFKNNVKQKLKWLKVYDVRGVLVEESNQQQLRNLPADSWDWPCKRFGKYVQSGLYFVVIEHEGGRKTYKVYIMK